MKKCISALLFVWALLSLTAYAQSSVAINNTGATPAPSAILDVNSSTQGFLTPRMTLAERTAIASPATGLLVYQTDGTAGFWYFDGTNWINLGAVNQSSTTYFTTGGITVTSATGLTFLTGFPVTVNVPAGYKVLLTADVGVATNSASTTGFSSVDVALAVDGAPLTDGGYQRTHVTNNGGIVGTIRYASMSQAVTVTPGNHTFGIGAGGTGTGSNATVGGNGTSVLQGELTITLIKL